MGLAAADLLVLLRIVLLPAVVGLLLAAHRQAAAGAGAEGLRWAAVALLAVLALSDLVDGWLARRSGTASRRGAVLDAAADKAAELALLFLFAVVSSPLWAPIPLWLPLLLVARDGALAAGWLLLRRTGRRPDPEHPPAARLAALLLFVLLLATAAGAPAPAVTGGSVLSGIAVVVAGVSYIGRWRSPGEGGRADGAPDEDRSRGPEG